MIELTDEQLEMLPVSAQRLYWYYKIAPDRPGLKQNLEEALAHSGIDSLQAEIDSLSNQ